MNKLQKLLDERGILLADGATGTNLIPMGLDSGQAPEAWNFDHVDRIQKLHQSFIDAGSDILVTNSFGGTARRLHLHQLDDRVVEVNEAAATIAGDLVANSGREIVVAGSVGPTGDLLVPLGELTYEGAVEAFIEQMTGLKKGGADVAWIETMSSPEEIDAAIEAANEVGMDYVVTASFDTAGKTMMGFSPADFGDAMQAKPTKPVAFGSNCGVGASDLLVAAIDLVAHSGGIPVVAKANAGIPRIAGDKVVYSGSPELMGDYAKLAMNLGISIIGGCCGNSPAHVKAMADAVREHNGGDAPTAEEIIEILGPLVSPKTDKTADRSNRRRKRS
ncbi:betaine--homocysteine S-methyltransferase [Maritalea porphyrae]|jgi:methionine synthase I (cobalamin-dependent)|uniref:betaine--homocysteine S-methyltransferase n=1 Tax=Maritalea porphyrae TaxID=880732 RepID=UPI0022AEC014|nr:betaine--homocysteine S-methyltransferase [Maritalea porphyrae]MCZ4273097.1 betaine--homocysteine S-methyltransferase [Maritalea porphyrae]